MAAPRPEFYNSYDNVASPPPGQGYFPSHSNSRAQYNDRHDRRGSRENQSHQQQQQQQQHQPYFDPPPQEEYQASADSLHHGYPPRQQYDYGPPPDSYASPRASDRGVPPLATENQLTPYDDERAEAEWRRGVDDAYSYQRPRPPSSAAEIQRQFYDDDLMREQQRERERDRRYYEEREREREDREWEREQRIRRDEEAMKEKAMRYPSDPKKGGRDIFGSSEGERGLAAKLAGGAGGALIAHEKRAGALGTIGSIVVGALAGTIIENQLEKRKEKKEFGSRDHVPYPGPGRDMEDVRRTGRDGGVTEARGRSSRDYSKPRERSKSGFRDRLRQSLSRMRSKSRPRSRSVRRRRSDSYDSEDSRYR